MCQTAVPTDSENLETIWHLIRRPVMPRQVSHVVIGVIYHPPDASNAHMINHIANAVDSVLQQHSHAGVLILGDFNALNDKPIRDYPLKQIVNTTTRGKATLDKIYTNISNWYFSPNTVPNIGSSDHCGIILLPTDKKPTLGNDHINITVRSNSANGKNPLVDPSQL